MSLFGTLNTAVSGMAAQANKLGTIGDNIANSSTTGYKRATTDFETMLGDQSAGGFTAGGVQTRIRYGIADQGTLTSTTSVTDIAVKGTGFFVVRDANGATALTRAGSFVPDAAGNLVNTAGYQLMGYNLTDGSSAIANGLGGLQVINLSKQSLTASPSQTGSMEFNLPSNSSAIASGSQPTSNAAGAQYTAKTSVAAYDDLGNQVTLDIYFSKNTDGSWQATTFNQANAAAGGGFPYSAGPLANQQMVYDQTTGKLTSVDGSTSALNLAIPVPNGKTLTIGVSQTTQLAAAFSPGTVQIDGSAPSKLDHVTIGADGTVTSVYADGIQQATYRIPLADVPSVDNLTSLTGNIYQPSLESGNMTIGAAQSGTLGQIDSNSLESSTVDLATELTTMISAQRSYEANSKVIQASADLLQIVGNLKG